MTDGSARLTAALADRYRIERELGAGRHGHGLPGRGPQAPSQGGDQGAHGPSWRRRWAPSASCARSRRRRASGIRTSCPSTTRARAATWSVPVLRHAVRRGRVAARPAEPREAAADRGGPADRARGGRRAGLCARAGRGAPRHQAREHPARRAATRWWRTSGIARAVSAAGGEQADPDRDGDGDPGLHESRSRRRATATWTGGATSTAWAACCTRCWRGQPPFSGPNAQAITRQHLVAEAAPVTNLRPTVPAEVAGALARTLAKNPADRFNPAAQFVQALTAPVAPHVCRRNDPRAAGPDRRGCPGRCVRGLVGEPRRLPSRRGRGDRADRSPADGQPDR